MNTTNPLLTTLEIIEAIGTESASTSDLQARFEISVATLKRHLAEARLLGADIQSIRTGTSWMYHLKNNDAVRVRVAQWIELERTRDLTA